ncbi:MAG: ComF family protein [Bacillota bacterium]
MIAARYIPGWIDGLLELLYPPRCLLCQALLPARSPDPLCSRCRPLFSHTGQICPQCERIYSRRAECACLAENAPLQGLFALSWYADDWRRMLHRLKYRGERRIARPLGSWLGRLLASEISWPVALVAPLPLYHRREKERGYNQSALIARAAARELRLPLVHLLQKTRQTASQTGFSYAERRKNVAGVYSPVDPLPRPCAVLLVDDIYSTGATLREAASVLRQCGFTVFGAVAAYNPRLF